MRVLLEDLLPELYQIIFCDVLIADLLKMFLGYILLPNVVSKVFQNLRLVVCLLVRFLGLLCLAALIGVRVRFAGQLSNSR